MVKLPASISDPNFDQQFKRGIAVKTLFHFKNDKEKYKYLVILNHDVSKDPVVFVLTTSRTEFYDKNPHFNKDILRIKAGSIDFFPIRPFLANIPSQESAFPKPPFSPCFSSKI